MAYTKEEIAFIQENLQEEEDFLKQSLREMCEMPLPTQLKSAEILQKEQDNKVEGMMQFMVHHTNEWLTLNKLHDSSLK